MNITKTEKRTVCKLKELKPADVFTFVDSRIKELYFVIDRNGGDDDIFSISFDADKIFVASLESGVLRYVNGNCEVKQREHQLAVEM